MSMSRRFTIVTVALLTLYVYAPDLDRRQLKTIRVEDR